MQTYTNRLMKYLEKLDIERVECCNQIFYWQNELKDAKEMLNLIDENSPIAFAQKRRVLTAKNFISTFKSHVEQIDIEQAELETQLNILSPEM
jgi:hypothetical protein